MKALTLIALLAASLAGYAQQTRLLTADRHNEYGIVYSLPVTSLVFDIEAEQSVSRTGPFYRYAAKYVGTSDVVKEDSESWQVKSVRMTLRGIPGGPSRTYLMQLKAGSDVTVCVAGEGDGMLRSINTDVPADVPEEAPRTVAGVGDAARQAQADVKDYLQYVDEDFLVSQSSAMRARMLSETLMAVRESRLSLSRGTAETMPVDGRQLELMLQSLSAQEKALTEAFTGATARQTLSHRYVFTPDSADLAGSREVNTVLGRLSDFAGFTDADDLSGEPLRLTISYTSLPEIPLDEKGEPKRLPKDAVAYTIPATARITLTWMGRTIYSGTADIAQQGVVFGLDPKLFTDRKAPSQAEFDPATGALLSISRRQQ